MAPRAYWKGHLRLSLVPCPIQLFPAVSEREKIRFHLINKKTANRIKYYKIDAVTGEPVRDEDIVKGYEIGKGRYIEVPAEELEAVAIGSTHTLEIDQFVPRNEIDELYWNIPYYMTPDGEVGKQAFAVIREAIKTEGKVALGHVVFPTREHVIAVEPRGKGTLRVTLRYPYEIRKEADYFGDLPDEEVPKGHARSCGPYRQYQGRTFRAGEVRGSLRERAQGADPEKATWRKDRNAEGAQTGRGGQLDGRTAAQLGSRAQWPSQSFSARRRHPSPANAYEAVECARPEGELMVHRNVLPRTVQRI
jgi:Ku protein